MAEQLKLVIIGSRPFCPANDCEVTWQPGDVPLRPSTDGQKNEPVWKTMAINGPVWRG